MRHQLHHPLSIWSTGQSCSVLTGPMLPHIASFAGSTQTMGHKDGPSVLQSPFMGRAGAQVFVGPSDSDVEWLSYTGSLDWLLPLSSPREKALFSHPADLRLA